MAINTFNHPSPLPPSLQLKQPIKLQYMSTHGTFNVHTHTHTHACIHKHTMLQRGHDCGVRYRATSFTITVSVTETGSASLQVFWPIAHGNTSHCEQQVCTLGGEIHSGKYEVELVVKVAGVNRSEGAYSQLVAMVIFENSHGESKATLTSQILGKQLQTDLICQLYQTPSPLHPQQ